MVNITEDGNFTGKLNQTLIAWTAHSHIFFSALNIFLSVTASLGNALILIALRKVSSIHPPTKLFFRCLAVTDLCVGLIAQPLYATYIMLLTTQMNVLNLLNQINSALDLIFCGVSVATSTAISVDRLLALLLGLRYRHVVTLRRVRVVIICFWFICASDGAICLWKQDISFFIAFVFMTLFLVISIFCYTKIHHKLRHHQVQAQNHVPQEKLNRGGIPLNIARYKKTVSSIMWVQLTLLVCYIPWGVVAVLYANGIHHQVAWDAATTLIYLNSSLNPILYCWKIGEVKQAVKDTIRQLKCFFK